jgi:hypothetical protein
MKDEDEVNYTICVKILVLCLHISCPVGGRVRGLVSIKGWLFQIL